MLEECERARPGFAASQVTGLPYRHAADNARMRDGLMKAGLGDLQPPEGEVA